MSGLVFHCSDCCGKGYDRHYASEAALRKHMQKWHGANFSNPVFSCPLCSTYSGNSTLLKTHYENDHGLDLKKDEKVFLRMADFNKWKSDLEKSTGSEFIKRRGSYTTNDGTEKFVYTCSRDGKYKSRSTGLRTAKIQGSKKINSHCPARMKLSVSKGIIRVDFIGAHVGHSVELGQVALTKGEREKIARKIESKVPFNAILEEVRESVEGDRLTRVNLLNRQDLYNIEKNFALSDKSVRQSNSNLESWMEKINVHGPIVRYYKPQGEEAMDENDIQTEDLVLVFFSEAQLEVLKKFSERCICIDRVSTSLTAILVVDDFEQAFPTAFLISNRTDFTILKLFFKIVKAAVGCSIITEVFMCGVDQAHYNSWSEVMSPAGRVLCCSWLVDSDWRSHLMTIRDKFKQDEVYKNLKVIMGEPDEDTFNAMFEEFCLWLVEDVATMEFGTYFIQKYGCSAMQWAHCCRKTVEIDTKTQLERVHKTMEHIYSEGKTTEQLSKALQSLMHFSRDRLYDRLTHMEKVPSKLKELEKCHKKVQLELLIDCQVALEGNDWVLSLPHSSDVVRISKHNFECDCCVKCPLCSGCSHMYLCSCLDSTVKWKMCKHIHYLCEHLGTVEEVLQDVDADTSQQVQLDEVSLVSTHPDVEGISQVTTDVPSRAESVDDAMESEHNAEGMITTQHTVEAMITTQNLSEYKQKVNGMLRAVMGLVDKATNREEVEMYEELIKPVVTSLEDQGCFHGPEVSTARYASFKPNDRVALPNVVARKRKVDDFSDGCVVDDASTVLFVQNSRIDDEAEEQLDLKKVESVEIVFESDEEFDYAEEITLM